MATHTTDDDRCPYCNRKVNRASNATDNDIGPEVGDIAICLYCHNICVFDEGLKRRQATKEELAEVSKNPDLQSALRAARMVEV